MIGYGTRELTSLEYSAAGVVSGIATRGFVQPLDVLKIRFQLQQEPTFGATKGKYRGIVQACAQIYNEEGLFAFWKGHMPAQGLSAVYGLVQFATFEVLTDKARRFPLANENRRVVDIICGALAGCTAMTCAMPLDVIRTRLVAQSEQKVCSFLYIMHSPIRGAGFQNTSNQLGHYVVVLWQEYHPKLPFIL